MDKPKLTFNKSITPVVFISFVVIVFGIFFENILFFKAELLKAFIEPPVQKVVKIDLLTLARIEENINVSSGTAPVINQ